MTSPLMERCLKVEYINGYRCDSYDYGYKIIRYDVDDDVYVRVEECKQCLEIISGEPRKIYGYADDFGASYKVGGFPECYNNASFSSYRKAKDCVESMMWADLGAIYMISTHESIFWFMPDDYTVVRVN